MITETIDKCTQKKSCATDAFVIPGMKRDLRAISFEVC